MDLLPVWAVAQGVIVGPVRLVVNHAGPEIMSSNMAVKLRLGLAAGLYLQHMLPQIGKIWQGVLA